LSKDEFNITKGKVAGIEYIKLTQVTLNPFLNKLTHLLNLGSSLVSFKEY
jgi:hypothetical protein